MKRQETNGGVTSATQKILTFSSLFLVLSLSSCSRARCLRTLSFSSREELSPITEPATALGQEKEIQVGQLCEQHALTTTYSSRTKTVWPLVMSQHSQV